MAASNSLNMNQSGVQTFDSTTGILTGSATTQYNVIVGDTNNKIANIAPSATSGIPLISSGSSANPAFGTAVVAGGGTGNTTFTAYSVINAGTTAQGTFQNVSGLGNSGQVLTSNGPSALPTWQPMGSSGGKIVFTTSTASSGVNLNPADSTTYYIADGQGITLYTTAQSCTRIYMPVSGTISVVYGSISVTTGTSESVTLSLRLNDTSNTTISNSINMSASPIFFNNTGLSLSVSAGDYLSLIMICPAWVTNPTVVRLGASIVLNT